MLQTFSVFSNKLPIKDFAVSLYPPLTPKKQRLIKYDVVTRGKAQGMAHLRRTLRHVDSDRQAIFRKGPRQVGLKSMDIVTELHQRGALKGFKRPEHQWN